MLNDRLIIDSDDAFETYGLYIRDGGMASVIGWPQFKKIYTSDWYETDGIDADLSSPVFEGRQIQIPFHNSHRDAPSMFKLLMHYLTTVPDTDGSVYHIFHFPDWGVKYSLRYVSNGSYDINGTFDTFTLTMAEDSVTKPKIGNTVTLDFGDGDTETFTIAVPATNSVPFSGYRVDGVDFAKFGMFVTQGTLDQFQKYAKVKEAMKRDVSVHSGIIYDSTGTIYKQQQDVTVNLHLRTADVTDFWKMWYALFATLMDDGEHIVDGAGCRFVCYYKSANVTRLLMLEDGGVWCDFTVTLAVLRNVPVRVLGLPTSGDSKAAIIDNNNVIISI